MCELSRCSCSRFQSFISTQARAQTAGTRRYGLVSTRERGRKLQTKKKKPMDFEANVFWVFSHIWIKISFQVALRFHKNASLTAINRLVSSSMDSRLNFLKSFQEEESVFCSRFNIFIWVCVYFFPILFNSCTYAKLIWGRRTFKIEVRCFSWFTESPLAKSLGRWWGPTDGILSVCQCT